MGARFDRDGVERVLAAVVDRLEGDWLIIGGAYVALWLEDRRTTEDVDLVPVGAGAQRSKLLGVAVDLGLPVEAVNSAADFFLEKIEGWRDEIELLRSGAKGRIFRPSATLFLLLKARRLSAQDLEDCRAELARARREGRAVDAERVIALLRGLKPGDADLEARRLLLQSELSPSSR